MSTRCAGSRRVRFGRPGLADVPGAARTMRLGLISSASARSSARSCKSCSCLRVLLDALLYLFVFFCFLNYESFLGASPAHRLKLKSEGHPQHPADRAESRTRCVVLFPFSPSLLSSSRAGLWICLSGFVRDLPSGRGVFVSVLLHNNCSSKRPPASSAPFSLTFERNMHAIYV